MKSYRKELWFNIPARRGFVNITDQVEQCLKENGEFDGRRKKRVLVKIIGK